MSVLPPNPVFKAFDNNGSPLVGGKLFTYAAGTSTKIATYADANTVTPNANPVILDFRGEARVWVPPNVSYKWVLAPANDTDPPGSPIWTVDDLESAALLTLYGGVDTGIADAYVLDFDASFSAYADGIVIYWVAGNNNTGASTVNVNGLGPVDITQQDGTDLPADAILANTVTQMMYLGSGFVLLQSGSNTAGGISQQNTALASGNYQLVIGDIGKTIVMTAAVARTLTIPPDSVVPFPLGTIIYVESDGTAGLGIQRGAGVTLYQQNANTNANISIPTGVRSSIRLYKFATDTWIAQWQPLAGSVTGTLTGMTGSVTMTIEYRISGRICALFFSGNTGTSNATTMTFAAGTLPAVCRPTGYTSAGNIPFTVYDNGAASLGTISIADDGSIVFGKDFSSSGGFTGSGTKGILGYRSVVYPLV